MLLQHLVTVRQVLEHSRNKIWKKEEIFPLLHVIPNEGNWCCGLKRSAKMSWWECNRVRVGMGECCSKKPLPYLQILFLSEHASLFFTEASECYILLFFFSFSFLPIDCL
jgi:hypothetical protein